MTASTRTLGVVAVLLMVAACQRMRDSSSTQTGSSSDALAGAWRISDMKLAAGVTAASPPGLYLFATGHYSVTYANARDARPAFAKADAPTDAEKLQAYGTIIANAGTYSLIGDTLVIRPTIAKNPSYMGGGEDRFTVRTAGDTLWLTGVSGAFRWANGTPSTEQGSDTFTLVRAR